MSSEKHTLPCGRNVTIWDGCNDCPDFPCKEHWKNKEEMIEKPK